MKTLLFLAACVMAVCAEAVEYKVSVRRMMATGDAAQQKFLNETASEGWELVDAEYDSVGNVVFYFKRETAATDEVPKP